MASSTHCYKSWLNRALCAVWAGVLWLLLGFASAYAAAEISQIQAERLDEEIVLSAQVDFALAPALEEALLKGIPMVFVTEAAISRERWYWYDKKLASTERHFRLAFQPLARRWRLQTIVGGADVNAVNQNFDTLEQALSAMKRVTRWKIADASELESATKYKVEFRFRLDLNQLPRPFQIGAIGQADWVIAATAITPLPITPTK
jgi:hypothetical protein